MGEYRRSLAGFHFKISFFWLTFLYLLWNGSEDPSLVEQFLSFHLLAFRMSAGLFLFPRGISNMFPHHESLFADSLYCEEEESWGNGEVIQSHGEEEEGEGEGEGDNGDFDEGDSWEDEDLTSLLKKEMEIGLCHDFDEYPFSARAEAVEWMLGVVGYYSFSAQTALLGVNCLDRFLCNFKAYKDKPWTIHLAAVACLSLAAKVEETQVPLLLDLQVESIYIFEAKTIQRMEILVLSTLQWKMNSVTPLSFIHYIAKQLGFKGFLLRDFLRRCESLLLSALSDCRFMRCLPSAIATATMLFVLRSFEHQIAVDFPGQLIGILGINKDKVEECCKLIQAAAAKLNPHSYNKRKNGSISESPTGIVDLCFSSDSFCQMGFNPVSVSSSPAPPCKKNKHGD